MFVCLKEEVLQAKSGGMQLQWCSEIIFWRVKMSRIEEIKFRWSL